MTLSCYWLCINSILVCEECGDFNFGDCPVHGPLLPVDDAKHVEYSNGISKARSTLPSGLEIRESSIEGAGLGVYSTEPIQPGIRFGPYQGMKVHRSVVNDERNSGYMWEVGAFWIYKPVLKCSPFLEHIKCVGAE